MSLFILIMIGVVVLLIFVFWLIRNLIKDVRDVKSGKTVIQPIPKQITTRDKNYHIRFGFAVIILVIMSGFLYFSTASSVLSTIGKVGKFIIWIVLFCLAYFITKIPRKCKLDGLKLEEWTKDTAWRYYRCPNGHISKEKIVVVAGR